MPGWASNRVSPYVSSIPEELGDALMTDVRARTSPGAWTSLRNLLCGLGLLLVLLTAAGCGTSRFTPGTAVVTISAKPGRFSSYIVTLDQILLTRNDGNTVQLPVFNQRVDLAHLDRYVSLLEAPAVEVGTYVSATMQIDYNGAYITADTTDIGGGVGTQAPPVDPASTSGAAAGVISVTVQFDPNHQLVITNPTSALLAFDIDLEASNILSSSTTTGTGWQTTVKPFWRATTTPAYDQPVFARGLYVNADTKNNLFIMNTRPFRDQVNNPFGALTVNVDDQTYYQINGQTYVGKPGLAALAALQSLFANLPIAAYGRNSASPFGNLNTITPSMSATQVYVGSSLESTIEDQITGIVSAVSGDVVTLADVAFSDRTGLTYGFQKSGVQVTLGPNTILSIDGVSSVTPSIQSISVGQFITANGVVTPDSTGTNPASMDATGNSTPGAQVRLQNTTLWGQLNSATPPPGNLFLNLQYVENFKAAAIPISTASNYQVATGAIDESTTAANTLLRVDGLATPLNTPQPPYFSASAITSAVNLNSQLVLEWPAGTSNGFTAITGGAININTADPALTTARILTGPVTTVDLLKQQPPANILTITYNTSDLANPPLYGAGSTALGEWWYSDNNAFAAKALSLFSANPAFKLVATGQYNPTSGTFIATSIVMNTK